MKRYKKLCGLLYQIAGERLLAPDELTEGQRQRIDELLLNTLSDPDRLHVSTVCDLWKMAKRP